MPTETAEFKLAATAEDVHLHDSFKSLASYEPGDEDVSCDARRKSTLISDLEWKKCHDKALRAQLEKAKQSNNTKNATSAAVQMAGSKVQLSTPKKDQDRPSCSSAGWCGEPWPDYLKEKDKVVEYKTGLPLDQDIRDSQGHLQDQEAVHGTASLNKNAAKNKE